MGNWARKTPWLTVGRCGFDFRALLRYTARMFPETLSRKRALQVLYWNAVVAALAVAIAAAVALRRAHRYDRLIVEISQEHGLDARLVSALIWRESRYDARCVGKAGEIGLMQVTEGAAGEWARAARVRPFRKETLFDPRTNVMAGCWYLARAIRLWSDRPDPLPYALAEYNAGRQNAVRWAGAAGQDGSAFIQSISYPTTQRYVKDILKRYRRRI